MNDNKRAKEYGIWNGEVCEWVLMEERKSPGYLYEEYRPRILKNTEITKLLRDGAKRQPAPGETP